MSVSGDRSETDKIRAAYSKRHERRHALAVVDYVLTERRRLLQSYVERFVGLPPAELTICDVGCGAGGDLGFWQDLGVPAGQLAGTELLADALEVARHRLPQADLRLVDDFMIPWPDQSFHVTWASMAMSSIVDPATRRKLFEEMRRITRRGGIVALYDFHIRKPTNRDVVAMNGKAIRQLGREPAEQTLLTPFLPLLGYALRLPAPFRQAAIAALPRTHSVWVWRTDHEAAPGAS
jgi:ubiquinone/menaquinone biosynthesis C-methylase UbiE